MPRIKASYPDEGLVKYGVNASTIDVDVRRIGQMGRVRYQRATLRKVGRRVKQWQGEWYVYLRTPEGREKRRRRTKILGPATMPKHEAQKLLDYQISLSSGQPSPSGLPANPTFAQLWARYAELKRASWGTSTAKTVQGIFAGTSRHKKHPSILSIIGHRRIAELSPDPLQALLNHIADRGESQSTIQKVRTYLTAALEYALAERLIAGNPARSLELPTKLLKKKPSERFYSIEEVQRFMSIATGREHLVLRILFVCGLRPQELLALRDDDVTSGALLIDEAIKEKEKGAKRLGETKSATSKGYVCISGGLYQEIENWLIVRTATCKAKVQGSPFLFPTNRGTSFRIGNYLKRHLKPLARRAGIPDFTFQAMRRTCATHFQRHGNPKDAQAQLRHSRLSMTGLYMKEIPEQVKAAVESLDAALCCDMHSPIN
jgi:integrase